MKVLHLLLILGLILSGLIIFDSQNNNEKELPANYPGGCEFNGKEFLLSGGSKIIHNNQEYLEEIQRINYLCYGE